MGTLLNKIFGFIFFFSKKIKHFLWKKIYDRLANTYEIFDWAFMNYGFDYNNKNQEPYFSLYTTPAIADETRARETVEKLNSPIH